MIKKLKITFLCLLFPCLSACTNGTLRLDAAPLAEECDAPNSEQLHFYHSASTGYSYLKMLLIYEDKGAERFRTLCKDLLWSAIGYVEKLDRSTGDFDYLNDILEKMAVEVYDLLLQDDLNSAFTEHMGAAKRFSVLRSLHRLLPVEKRAHLLSRAATMYPDIDLDDYALPSSPEASPEYIMLLIDSMYDLIALMTAGDELLPNMLINMAYRNFYHAARYQLLHDPSLTVFAKIGGTDLSYQHDTWSKLAPAVQARFTSDPIIATWLRKWADIVKSDE